MLRILFGLRLHSLSSVAYDCANCRMETTSSVPWNAKKLSTACYWILAVRYSRMSVCTQAG